MPMGDRWRERRRHSRLVRNGDTYTIDELLDGRVELEERDPDPNPPPEDVRGEPWGWTKGEPFPRGYRADENYGSAYRDRRDPGPLDGLWPDEVH